MDTTDGNNPAQCTRGKGRRRRPEYAIWAMMIEKCHNPKCRQFPNYGGKNIHVCDQWRGPGGFQRFLADVREQPRPGTGLRRVDESRGFEPGNVEWCDSRGRKLLSHEGRTMSVAAWARERKMKDSTLRARLRKGWTTEGALTLFVSARPPSWAWVRRTGPMSEDERQAAEKLANELVIAFLSTLPEDLPDEGV